MGLERFRVLFVCTGNTCRSTTAEAILKKLMEEQGAQLVLVGSAGTNAVEGLPANFLALSVAGSHGVNLMSHRSRPVSRKLMEKSDLIIVMAQNHYDILVKKFPKYKDKVHLLKNYGREEPLNDPEVVDPIGGDGELFEAVYQDINSESERIAPLIINESMDKF